MNLKEQLEQARDALSTGMHVDAGDILDSILHDMSRSSDEIETEHGFIELPADESIGQLRKYQKDDWTIVKFRSGDYEIIRGRDRRFLGYWPKSHFEFVQTLIRLRGGYRLISLGVVEK